MANGDLGPVRELVEAAKAEWRWILGGVVSLFGAATAALAKAVQGVRRDQREMEERLHGRVSDLKNDAGRDAGDMRAMQRDVANLQARVERHEAMVPQILERLSRIEAGVETLLGERRG